MLMTLVMNVRAGDMKYDTNPPFRTEASETACGYRAHPAKKQDFLDRRIPTAFLSTTNWECIVWGLTFLTAVSSLLTTAFRHRRSKRAKTARCRVLLEPGSGTSLYYNVRDNSYSEGNKMKYWQVTKDVYGDGKMDDPGDSMANYVWTHLFIYKDLEGTLPDDWSESKRLRVGRDIQVNIDSGPTGKGLAGGFLAYSGSRGGNKVFTDSMVPEVKNVPLTLTASYLWDALGLPLTAFNDSRRKGTIRSVSEKDFQPFQYSVVQLRDKDGKPVMAQGKPVEFFGTNPVDFPNCYLCHSGKGRAATMSRNEGLSSMDKEYDYWKKNYTDISEFMARQSQAAINILELHDKHYGTAFLKEYGPNAPSNRLGSVGPVYCADCHGDNVSGNLQSPRPGATGYQAVKARPLTEAIHMVHAALVPMPDKAGRTQSCQACHPAHWYEEEMNSETNPYRITDSEGKPAFFQC